MSFGALDTSEKVERDMSQVFCGPLNDGHASAEGTALAWLEHVLGATQVLSGDIGANQMCFVTTKTHPNG
jgi:hypothetical protein